MFIDQNQKRINIDAPFEDSEGNRYPNLRDPAVRVSLGIVEIADPARLPDETHYNQEVDEAPYLVSTPKSPEQVLEYFRGHFTTLVQSYLDDTGRQRGYDGILSACTYATSTNTRFAAEGQACVNLRDEVWTSCYAIFDAVAAGQRPIPTWEELLAELPVIQWPAV